MLQETQHRRRYILSSQQGIILKTETNVYFKLWSMFCVTTKEFKELRDLKMVSGT